MMITIPYTSSVTGDDAIRLVVRQKRIFLILLLIITVVLSFLLTPFFMNVWIMVVLFIALRVRYITIMRFSLLEKSIPLTLDRETHPMVKYAKNMGQNPDGTWKGEVEIQYDDISKIVFKHNDILVYGKDFGFMAGRDLIEIPKEAARYDEIQSFFLGLADEKGIPLK